MKTNAIRLLFSLLLVGGLTACERNPDGNMSAYTPVEFNDSCLGFVELGHYVCAFYAGNYGPDFQTALDSVVKVEQKAVDAYVKANESAAHKYYPDKTYLHFDTVHVHEDDVSLDRSRTYISVWLCMLQEWTNESFYPTEPYYLPVYDYGIIDNKGNRYYHNYPPD